MLADAKRHVRVEGAEPPRDDAVSPASYRPPEKVSRPTPIKILFLAANPHDTPTLKLDEEIKLIEERLSQAEFGSLFQIRKHASVRANDLQKLFHEHQPDIVHFSGHGSNASEIILEDSAGRSHAVPAKALSTLFALLQGKIRIVVLNACYTATQGRAIAEHIEWVVGMSRAIGDSLAIAFAASFYQALGYGYSIRKAFALAQNEIDLTGLGEANTPKILGPHTDATVFPSSNKLAKDLLSRSDGKRLKAAQELFGIPQKHLTPLLIHRSTVEPNVTVRYWINRALGKLCSPAAIDALRNNLDDPDHFARLGAEDALHECEK